MKKYIKKDYIFIAVLLISELFFWVIAILSNGSVIKNILFCQEQQTFCDFFECICIDKNPYELKGSYPPLAYLVFKFFAKIIPENIRTKGMFFCRETQMGMFSMMCFFSVSIVSIVLLIKKYYNEENLKVNLFIMSIISSLPMLFLIERMNIIIFILPLIFYYLENYKSENKIKKNLAYICLAVAAAIKIYPALLGFLVVKEKKIKEDLAIIAYGLLFFFRPFIFFHGVDGVKAFWINFTNSLSVLGDNLGYGYKINITNTVGWLLHAKCPESTVSLIGRILSIVIMVLGFLCLFMGKYKETWKDMAIIVLLMLLLPGFSFIYSLILFIPVIIFFLNDEINRFDNIYAVLFAVLFVPFLALNPSFFPELGNDYYQLNISTIIESITLLLIFLLLILEAFINNVNKFRGKH